MPGSTPLAVKTNALRRRNGPSPAGLEQRGLVNEIQAGYIVGVTHADERAAKAAKKTARALAKSAELLSTELYTKDDHAVLELVQNADDCSYALGVKPSFQLILFDSGLLVATNEQGFSAANVDALCDLGNSSKSRSLGAFTGEKGIGFKAVAMISQATYIDSGGFNFVLDTRPESYPDAPEWMRWLGLVCPAWVEHLSSKMEVWIQDNLAGVEGVDAGSLLEELEDFGTCMWLDLKPGCDRQRLAQQLASLSPFMLLNLRQLRRMRVLIATHDRCHDRNFSYTEGQGVITITDREGPWRGNMHQRQHHLLRLQKTIQVPEDIVKSEEKREGVHQVVLMFALPMEGDGATARPDKHAELFAFLPVGPYGFRFHIQADFVLPSNRQGIREGTAWNKWLRDQLAPAFVSEAMRALSDGSLNSAALLQFLPLPGDVLDTFMAAAADSMLQLLQQEACVLTASGQYSKPSSTVLPDPLLELADGQQLISNTWLQVGLPGIEYIHKDNLQGGSSSSDRARAVLQKLGASCFTADMLVRWLAAAKTEALLQSLPEAECRSWLRSLYGCLHKLIAQPAGSPLSLSDAQLWKKQLGSAAILPLHDQRQLTSYAAATSRGWLFLWNPAFGSAATVITISSIEGTGSSSSSSSCPLLLVDHTLCAAQPKVESVLRHFFAISYVSMSVLVHDLLQQQGTQTLSQSQRQQLLLFLMRNRQHLGPAAWHELKSRLQLQHTTGSGEPGYSLAAQLHYPLSIAFFVLVPAELQQDLMQPAAGVKFLHPWFNQLLTAGSDGISADDARSFLSALGVQHLSVPAAIKALLKLYRSDASLKGIRQQQHLCHLDFMASQPASMLSGLKAEISTSLRLYSHDQSCWPHDGGPKYAAGQLFAPVVCARNAAVCADTGLASAIQLQLLQAGVRCTHSCYSAASIHSFLETVAGVMAGADAVVNELLKLHSPDASDLRTFAQALGLDVGQLLLQQLQYIASHRTDLSSTVQASCKQHLLLLSSNGELLKNSCLMLPAADAASQQLIDELIESGSSLRVLSACFEPIWRNAESKLLLSELLRLPQANEVTVINSIIQVHTSQRATGSPVARQQLLQHLGYLAQHLQLLEKHMFLLCKLKQAVLLQDTSDKPAAAAELYFPMDPLLPANLQADMVDAGMRILHSSYAATAAGSSNSNSGSNRVQHLQELLQLLGVKTAGPQIIVQHILRLYNRNGGQAAVSEEQRLCHLAFFADNIKLLQDNSSLLQQVQEQVQLQDSDSSMYKAPRYLHHALSAELVSVQPDMLAAGMRFLHSRYTAAAAGSPAGHTLLHALLQLLGVATTDTAVIAAHILKLYQAYRHPSAMPQQQHIRHLSFFADHAKLLEDNSGGLLQQVQQRVLLLDSTGSRRQAGDLFFSLGADSADLQADMDAAGMHFIDSSYTEKAEKRLHGLLSQLGVRESDKAAVASYIVQLHKDKEPSCITEQQRSRHLAFLRDNLELLEQDSSRSLLKDAQQHLSLQDCNGTYRPAQCLWLPLPAQTAHLQEDLTAAGMYFVAARYTHAAQFDCSSSSSSSVGSSKHKRLLRLLDLLGVKEPNCSSVASNLTDLHKAKSQSLSEQQRRQHLAFFAANTHLLREDAGLLQALQQALLLLDSSGSYKPAGQLLFPLGREVSNLQASMDAARMPFLHSSYLETAAGGSGSSVTVLSKHSMWELLFALGVREPDADTIAAHILQLSKPNAAGSGSSSTTAVPFDQHLAHIQFLCSKWSSLEAAVKQDVQQQLQLRMQPGCWCNYYTAAAAAVYLLPPDHSREYTLMRTLQLGGALFLSQEYSAAASAELQGGARWTELEHWFQTALDVRLLQPAAAADIILSAHKSRKVLSTCSLQEIIQQGLYVAEALSQLASTSQQAQDLYIKAKEYLQLAVHPGTLQTPSNSNSSSNASQHAVAVTDSLNASAGGTVLYRTAAKGSLYWPAEGIKHDAVSTWQLQDILLPSEVAFIHPDYLKCWQEWDSAREAGLKSSAMRTYGLKRFFTQHLGLRSSPEPGSAALQAAIDAGNRWRPLLLLLSEMWNGYSSEEQQLLQRQLRGMLVQSSCGALPLCECYVPTSGLQASLLDLLLQLQLPLLDLPASSNWAFLQQLGVSTEPNWETLRKVLHQLAKAKLLTGSDSNMAAMRRLYELVHALALQNAAAAADIRECFEQQPLVFVRFKSKKDASGYWVRSKDVMWSAGVGIMKLFVDKTFIGWMYKDLEPFFCKQLGVKSTSADDLQGALKKLCKQQVTADTQDIYLCILKELARNAKSLSWLPNLLRQPVLLVTVPSAGSRSQQQLKFVSAAHTGGTLYLPDHPDMVKLFGQHCSLLAVPPEEVPGLQPLLQLVKPPLLSLGKCIKRSISLQDSGAVIQPESQLTQWLQDTAKLALRYVYDRDPQHYMQLLNSEQLRQVVEMDVCRAPGLVEMLSLPGPGGVVIRKQQEALAALSEAPTNAEAGGGSNKAQCSAAADQSGKVMLVNTSGSVKSQGRGMAVKLAELIFGRCLPLLDSSFVKQFEVLFLYNWSGGTEEAEQALQEEGVAQIPADKRPWLLPWEEAAGASAGRARSTAASAASREWADSGDFSDDDVSDTASSATATATAAAAAAQARGRSATAHSPQGLGLSTTAAATAGAATAGTAAATGAMLAGERSSSAKSRAQAPAAADMNVAGSSASSMHSKRSSNGVGSGSVCSSQHTELNGPAVGGYGTGQNGRCHAENASVGNGSSRPATSSVEYTESVSPTHSRSLKLTEEDQFAFSGSLQHDAAAVVVDSSHVKMMQQALSAGAAAGSSSSSSTFSSLQQLYSRPQATAFGIPLPNPPGFVSAPEYVTVLSADSPSSASSAAPAGNGELNGLGQCSSSSISSSMPSHNAGAVAANGGSGGGGGSSADEGTVRVISTTEIREDIQRSVTQTIHMSVDPGTAGTQADSSVSKPAGVGSMGGSMGESSGLTPAELTGAAGEVFLYGLLSKQLPNFNEANWCSGNRVHLPGSRPMQLPAREPSFDFMYEDAEGVLTGEPGTMCYIECKATAADLSGGSNPMPITPNEWALAWQVHRERATGGKCQYIIFRIDRVDRAGGPRLAAVLLDPVQLLAEGQLSITGAELRIDSYPLLEL